VEARPLRAAMADALDGKSPSACLLMPTGPGFLDLQRLHEVLEHLGIAALPGPEQEDQGPTVAVDQGVDLGDLPAAGTANRMVLELNEQILVIRQIPLCGVGCWCRAGGRGSPWNPPAPPS
jgi:hypothetical protein